MRPYIRTIETLELDGGWLCLDFINTVKSRCEDPHYCYFPGKDEIFKWIKRLGLYTGEEIRMSRGFLEEHPDLAGKQHYDVINMRETLYELFSAIARDDSPSGKTLRRFNKFLSVTYSHMKIFVDGNRLVKEEWKTENLGLLRFQDLIMKSAYELLKSDLLAKVKECESCGWLFLDRSKNISRRWCNMQTCGSTEKAKKYYQKQKESASQHP